MLMTPCTLLVPEHTDTNISVEFSHVKAWASTNHLTLNLLKTKEIVFKRSRVRCFHLPHAIDDIEQLDCNTLLGVLFQSNFKMVLHVQNILSQCGIVGGIPVQFSGQFESLVVKIT